MLLKKPLLIRFSLFVFYYFLQPEFLSAQEDTISIGLKSPLSLTNFFFESDTPLVFTLKLDIKKFQREKNEDKYHKAKLFYKQNDSTIIKKSVRIKARGIFRKELCTLPPYWLNTQRIKHKVDSLKVNQKYKIISHCNFNSTYEDYILYEYLVYKLYNQLTNYSFRVRLARFTYIDIGRKNKSYDRWGVILEPISSVSERLNSVQIKLNHLGINYTDTSTTDILSMFAYMIGNTDWSVAGRHNIKLIKLTDHNKPAIYPIPYDFDFTGFVNAPYAQPTVGLGLRNVQERIYLGPCRNLMNYQISAQHLFNNKAALYSVVYNFKHLPESKKSDLISYLDEYFSALSRKDFIKFHIAPDCFIPDE